MDSLSALRVLCLAWIVGVRKLTHRVDGGPWGSVAGTALLSLVTLNTSIFFS